MNLEPRCLALLPGMPNWAEILIIVVLALVLFGKKLPMFGRNLGRGTRNLKTGVLDLREEFKEIKSPEESDVKKADAGDTTSENTSDA